ncbi:MAG TPA: DNA-binding response regulator [Ruminococcaceae bacterium]|nr:DNA-binding response regulator [Oscillospiraceae bacterium]
MIQIAIVEDEASYADKLAEYLRRYETERKEPIEFSVFSDGDEIVEGYKAGFDIILLDIQMRFMDGMTAAKRIRDMDSRVVIIFITNMTQYAIQGYAVDALDYVLKPVTYFALAQRLDRAITKIKKHTINFVAVPVKGGMLKLDVSKIYYIESQGHNIIFHTAGGTYTASGTMKKWTNELESMHFFRGNNSYLINLEHVDGVKDCCALVKGERLLLSRMRKAAFMEALADYICEVVAK